MARTKTTTALAIPTPGAIVEEFRETGSSPGLLRLIAAADTGDPGALAHLRAVYAEVPEIAYAVSSWQYHLEQEILGTAQPGVAATFAVQEDRWRKRLAGEDPSPIESLLANRIVVDHLHALKTEHALQQKLGCSLSPDQAEHYQKQAERAQRRLLRATKALAEVRRLLRPAVQINVADQQIVAGTVNAGPSKTN